VGWITRPLKVDIPPHVFVRILICISVSAVVAGMFSLELAAGPPDSGRVLLIALFACMCTSAALIGWGYTRDQAVCYAIRTSPSATAARVWRPTPGWVPLSAWAAQFLVQGLLMAAMILDARAGILSYCVQPTGETVTIAHEVDGEARTLSLRAPTQWEIALKAVKSVVPPSGAALLVVEQLFILAIALVWRKKIAEARLLIRGGKGSGGSGP